MVEDTTRLATARRGASSAPDPGYRPDVDGLRAIAVMAVVLFHAGFESLAGGFVGVDVFFVISGYLITGILLRQVERGEFSARRFYVRRFRRLFPAVGATTFLTLLFGLFILTPEQFENLGASTLAATFSLSNVFFWLDSGYFSASAWTKPLLHTWSLGVEEQFYLVWPALLIGLSIWARKAARPWLVWAGIGSIGTVSFIACVATLPYHPSATFYLMPFRMFEFALGAAALFAERRLPAKGLAATVAFLVGAAAVAGSIAFMRESVPFPGVAALPVAMGTALLIWAGGTGRRGAILRSAPMVRLGRMSYSVYLVHWPIAVYWRLVSGGEVTLLGKVAMVAISLVLGYALYLLVEERFREPSGRERRRTYGARRQAGAILVSFASLVPAVLIYVQSGWTWRLPETTRLFVGTDSAMAADALNGGRGCSESLCPMGADAADGVSVLLVGDSHVHHLYAAMDAYLAERGLRGVMFQDGNCAVFTSGQRAAESRSDNCPAVRDLFRNYAARVDAPVIIAQNWPSYREIIMPDGTRREFGMSEDGAVVFADWIAGELVAFREGLGNRPVMVIGAVPRTTVGGGVRDCMLKPDLLARLGLAGERNRLQSCGGDPAEMAAGRVLNPRLEAQLATAGGFVFIDPAAAFCDTEICLSATSRGLIYRDNTHLSVFGGTLLISHFRELFDRMIAPVAGAADRISIVETDPADWFPQAGAEVLDRTDSMLTARIPSDGRLTRHVELERPTGGPALLELEATLVFEEPVSGNIQLTLQRECGVIAEEGETFDIPIFEGEVEVRRSIVLTEPAACVMVRLWRRGEGMRMELVSPRIEVSSL
jgi:peptidoglycan/LPS O-acetylase OafA/YrhL